MENKKAQSEVITTVLIILLVLAAVFIVWTAVKSMITTKSGDIVSQSNCLGVDIFLISANYSSQKVSVQRNAGGDDSAAIPVILVNGVITEPDSCAPISVSTGLKPLEATTCIMPVGTLASGKKVKVGLKFGDTLCDAVSEEKDATA